MLPYVVGAVVAVTVTHALLFVLRVYAARVMAVLVWGSGEMWLQ